MLIRSQDKHSLINLDNIARLTVGKVYGKDKTNWLVEFDKQPFTESLGQYTTEGKAIKVLDMIQQAYELSLYSDHAFDNAAQVQRPYIFVNNTVFQMPSDEEVEG